MDRQHRTAAVTALLAQIEQGEISLIPILCDALQDAGCERWRPIFASWDRAQERMAKIVIPGDFAVELATEWMIVCVRVVITELRLTWPRRKGWKAKVMPAVKAMIIPASPPPQQPS